MLIQPTQNEILRVSRRQVLVTFGALGAAVMWRREALAATPEVPQTEDNIEGPFYKPGAPESADLIQPGMIGTPLTVSGRVLSTRGEPLANALLDVWQANAEGVYDNQGFTLRGRLNADKNGYYRLRTIIPKYYKAGDTIRPAHIHLKVGAPGCPLLTTQLYFKGVQYNYVDPDVRPSLMLTLRDARDGKLAQFDFVLRHA